MAMQLRCAVPWPRRELSNSWLLAGHPRKQRQTIQGSSGVLALQAWAVTEDGSICYCISVFMQHFDKISAHRHEKSLSWRKLEQRAWLLELAYESLVEAVIPQAAFRRLPKPVYSVPRHVVVEPIPQKGRHQEARQRGHNRGGWVERRALS
jgi:hypothetical protein